MERGTLGSHAPFVGLGINGKRGIDMNNNPNSIRGQQNKPPVTGNPTMSPAPVQPSVQQEVAAAISEGVTTGGTNYTTTITLPSRGLLYQNIPAEIEIRCMTTAEEKILFASNGGNSIERVIKNCIVTPKNIDMGELTPVDEQYILLQLRSFTYGSEYTVTGICPHCKHKESGMKINLDEFETYQLPEDFQEPIVLTLPVSGDVLELRILRKRDIAYCERHAKKVAKSTNAVESELEYGYRRAKQIVSVNGEVINFTDAQNYFNAMHSKDSAYITYKLNQIVYGSDTTVIATCERCGEEYEFSMPITYEFFRPSFE